MNGTGDASLRTLVLAPSGRDAPLSIRLLEDAGFSAAVCQNLAELTQKLWQGAGVLIIADEAIDDEQLQPLVNFLDSQPTWSDVPIILLTRRGGGPEDNPGTLRLASILGNVSFLERPFHPTTLTSMVRAAARGRRRQYEARLRLEQIREREQQLQTALTAGRLGAWTLDVASMSFQISDTSAEHFGSDLRTAPSYQRWLQWVYVGDRSRVQRALEHALRSGLDFVIEFRNGRPDGSLKWIDVRARAVRDHKLRVCSLVGVSSDISSRKQSELDRETLLADLALERTALSDLTRDLELRVARRTSELTAEIAAREKAQEQLMQSQKMESVGQLTGGIAHDFNNLLMAVIGNLEILRKRLPNDPSMQRLIEGAMQGAQRGASLTQRMLAFARQQDLRTVSADLGALVSGMRELLQRTLGPGNDLRISIAPGLPPAQIDSHQVELAILNLALNARDSMSEGGAIDVHVDVEYEDEIPNGLRPGAYLRISIRDTGRGMNAATLAKAIEPFFSTKPLGKGTGLGLSMVHGLAVQLGGSLELASEPGQGTTATLWLPQASTAASGPETVSLPSAAARIARILVVDDDPLVAMSTVDMLEDLGHTVFGANGAEQALDIIDRERPLDLLITDHAMPGMTGIQLAEVVRRKRPHLPILLATGYADLPASRLANLPRLSKPYQQAQLQAQIETLLGVAQPELH